jgi:hypothetical protein
VVTGFGNEFNLISAATAVGEFVRLSKIIGIIATTSLTIAINGN